MSEPQAPNADGQGNTPVAGAPYVIQPGDTLISIAQQAYNDDSHWTHIYIANAEVIGHDPYNLTPGTQLFLLANPHNSRAYHTVQNCLVNVPWLNIRAHATQESAWVASFPHGTTLNFYEVVEGEMVSGNPYWGHSIQNHYYWMGGTDRPNG